MHKFLFVFLFFVSTLNVNAGDTTSQVYDGKHEWRAVWIATVDNIDWPSRRDLTIDQQQKELVAYLDLFKSLHFNAVILQIRPAADAMYASRYEPWSLYLTGDQRTPVTGYDPLSFAITEAHKRGMELHAWLNPYRVLQNIEDTLKLARVHLYYREPDLFLQYKKKLYFDPGYPQTRGHLINVVKDIVSRYDVDGIHFDDYFYPDNDVDDRRSYSLHARGFTDKMAWRRDNVNLAIKMLHDTIKHIKPYLKFGVSPYAVWRNLRDDPRGSDTRSFAYTNYDNLHADILSWMQNGWLDYILPQLYFNIGYANADFAVLARWWQQYSYGTPLYGGLGTYRLDSQSKIAAWQSADEIKKQAFLLRSMRGYQGACYFNARNFKDDRLGINKIIRELYPHPALVPSVSGFAKTPPLPPQKVKLRFSKGKGIITWKNGSSSAGRPPAKYYTVYKVKKNSLPSFSQQGDCIIALTGEAFHQLDEPDKEHYDYYVSALDRLYNESKAVKAR